MFSCIFGPQGELSPVVVLFFDSGTDSLPYRSWSFHWLSELEEEV